MSIVVGGCRSYPLWRHQLGTIYELLTQPPPNDSSLSLALSYRTVTLSYIEDRKLPRRVK